MMDDLVTWLRAQMDADEAAARMAFGDEWTPLTIPRFSAPGDVGELDFGDGKERVVPTPETAWHIARHDPASVLRDVQLLAAVYADRPGYREEWGPQ